MTIGILQQQRCNYIFVSFKILHEIEAEESLWNFVSSRAYRLTIWAIKLVVEAEKITRIAFFLIGSFYLLSKECVDRGVLGKGV